MTRSPLWREFESGDNLLLKALRFTIVACALFFLVFATVLELTWPQQAVLGLLILLVAAWMDRSSTRYLVTLTLMLLSCFSTVRYGYWRIGAVVHFFTDPGNQGWTGLDAFFILPVLCAELYAFATLFLGYLQVLWPLCRAPVPLPEDTDQWPEVDLLIPTYNEPLGVVRYTALAAMNIDWPADRLNVYILDDGRRDEFRAFAEDAGIGYMTRKDRAHAKAGNINAALALLDAPYVAIFDADHVPTRSFLQLTMGWFGRDARLGMLQTPHHLYSPDPFERNLSQFRSIPNEGELFYGVVQDGNDFWNATLFCGSCAILRRSALDDVGGIATETLTEDAHTSLRMQMQAWNTAYINIPQAAGLATERLSGHVRQRIRWARGMVQILRTDNPLFVPGLTLAQRLCYFNAMMHFLYALPRMIFLTAPLIYLFFGRTNVPGYWAAILAYALPHLILGAMTQSRIQGQHRHSFWNQIYETALAPYLFFPTMLALVDPKRGDFNVTAKGKVVSTSFFDTRIAQPFLVLLGMNFFGLLCAVPRFVQFPGSGGGLLGLLANMYDGTHRGTIAINVLWTCFNIVVLGVATAVAHERQQRRATVRVNMTVPAGVVFADGTVVQGVTHDLSSGGVMLRADEPVAARPGDAVRLVFPVLDGDATLPATLMGVDGRILRAHFDPLTMQEEEALTMVLYSRADTWLGWGEAREADRPLMSAWRILQLSMQGLGRAAQSLVSDRRPAPRARLATTVLPLLLPALLGAHPAARAQAAGLGARHAVTAVVPAVAPGQFHSEYALADLGVRDAVELRGGNAQRTIHFRIPQTDVVRTSTLTLHYTLSPGLSPGLSDLQVSLNGVLVAMLPASQQAVSTQPATRQAVSTQPASQQPATQQPAKRGTLPASNAANAGPLTATLALPAELLVHTNELTLELIGHSSAGCQDRSNSTPWAQVAANSSIALEGSLLPLPDDLALLPLPFYNAGVGAPAQVPIVFLAPPSTKALAAAGIVASYFGMLGDARPVTFPVAFGAIPPGNAIVLSERAADLPAGLRLGGSGGPTLAMRTNPVDPYGKLLVLTGSHADDLLVAARVVALEPNLLQGSQAQVTLQMPPPRQPDDAPRWLPTDRNVPIGQYAQGGDLQSDGSEPVTLYPRVPPDLYYGRRQNLALRLNYRYNGVPLAGDSTLQVYINGAYVSSTPMPHSAKASAALSTLVPIPIVDMRPFSNTALLKFVFDQARNGQCDDGAPSNLQGAVLKDSYLDLTGIPHWATLPNLELFANAGFPFTRLADLADTSVVLPDAPSPEEVELYLALMAHFGAQTGYPVLRMRVIHPGGMQTADNKDFLVLGTADDQAVSLDRLKASLPVQIGASGVHVQDAPGAFSWSDRAWWKVRNPDRVQGGRLEIAGGLPDAIVEGLQSPLNAGRSIVLVVLRDKTVAPHFVSAFLGTAQSGDMAQSVSVLSGQRFVSYRIGSDAYHVGTLNWWVRLSLLFGEYPALAAILVVMFCCLIAALLRAVLRRHARARLKPAE